jgi:uncharacterized membrane protein
MMRSLLRKRPLDRSGEEGAVAIMAAALLAALMVATSLAVDVGRVSYVSRDQQGTTDRAALDALGSLAAGSTAQDAYEVVLAALERNDGSVGVGRFRHVTCVAIGHQPADAGAPFQAIDVRPSTPPEGFPTGTEDDEDAASACPDVAGTLDGPVNAAYVNTASFVPFLFALGDDLGGRSVVRTSIAREESYGVIQAGTRVATVQDGLANALLAGLLDAELSPVTLAGFDGMAGTAVQLGDVAARLGIGTVTELAEAEVAIVDLIAATARALEADGDALGVSADAFAAEIHALGGLGTVSMSDILAVSTGNGVGGDVAVDALSLVTAALQASNKSNFVALEANVLGGIPIEVHLVEPPRIAAGAPGRDASGAWRTVARTAQVDVRIQLPVGETVTPLDERAITDRIAYYQSRASWAESGSLASTRCNRRAAVLEEIDAEVEAIRTFAAGYPGLLEAISGVLDSLVGLLDGLLSGLSCTLAIGPSASDVQTAIADFETLLRTLSPAAAGVTTTVRPTLAVTGGRGELALAEIECVGDLAVTVEGASDAVHVALPQTTLLHLGPVGRVTARIDASIGAIDPPQQRVVDGPFAAPVDPRFSSSVIGLGGIIDGVHIDLTHRTFGTEALVTDLVRDILRPILLDLDTELTQALDLLGVEIGVLEGEVLDARCDNRRLVR